MPATYTTLQLTDGTTTVDLLDGTNYALVNDGWSPAVPQLRTSALGGRGPYEDVEEEIAIDILGASGATLIANVDTIYRLIDQAARWARGEPVTAVVLKLQMQGSTLAGPVQAAVLGGELRLPTSFNDMFMVNEVAGARLILQRRVWIYPATTQASSASGFNSGTKLSMTFGAAATTTSPLILDLNGFNDAYLPSTGNSFLATTPDAANLDVFEAETLATGAYTSVADAAGKASGGNVLKYTPAVTTYVGTSTRTLSMTARRVAVLATIRNNSATTTWQVRPILYSLGPVTTLPPIAIDTSTTSPRVVFLGVASAYNRFLQFSIEIAASAASGSLDIDAIVLVGLDDERSRVISMQATTVVFTVSGGMTLTVENNPMKLQPIVGFYRTADASSGVRHPFSYLGDPALQTRGTTVQAVWLAVKAGYWRFVDNTSTLTTHQFIAYRYDAYLTPP